MSKEHFRKLYSILRSDGILPALKYDLEVTKKRHFFIPADYGIDVWIEKKVETPKGHVYQHTGWLALDHAYAKSMISRGTLEAVKATERIF